MSEARAKKALLGRIAKAQFSSEWEAELSKYEDINFQTQVAKWNMKWLMSSKDAKSNHTEEVKGRAALVGASLYVIHSVYESHNEKFDLLCYKAWLLLMTNCLYEAALQIERIVFSPNAACSGSESYAMQRVQCINWHCALSTSDHGVPHPMQLDIIREASQCITILKKKEEHIKYGLAVYNAITSAIESAPSEEIRAVWFVCLAILSEIDLSLSSRERDSIFVTSCLQATMTKISKQPQKESDQEEETEAIVNAMQAVEQLASLHVIVESLSGSSIQNRMTIITNICGVYYVALDILHSMELSDSLLNFIAQYHSVTDVIRSLLGSAIPLCVGQKDLRLLLAKALFMVIRGYVSIYVSMPAEKNRLLRCFTEPLKNKEFEDLIDSGLLKTAVHMLCDYCSAIAAAESTASEEEFSFVSAEEKSIVDLLQGLCERYIQCALNVKGVKITDALLDDALYVLAHVSAVDSLPRALLQNRLKLLVQTKCQSIRTVSELLMEKNVKMLQRRKHWIEVEVAHCKQHSRVKLLKNCILSLKEAESAVTELEEQANTVACDEMRETIQQPKSDVSQMTKMATKILFDGRTLLLRAASFVTDSIITLPHTADLVKAVKLLQKSSSMLHRLIHSDQSNGMIVDEDSEEELQKSANRHLLFASSLSWLSIALWRSQSHDQASAMENALLAWDAVDQFTFASSTLASFASDALSALSNFCYLLGLRIPQAKILRKKSKLCEKESSKIDVVCGNTKLLNDVGYSGPVCEDALNSAWYLLPKELSSFSGSGAAAKRKREAVDEISVDQMSDLLTTRCHHLLLVGTLDEAKNLIDSIDSLHCQHPHISYRQRAKFLKLKAQWSWSCGKSEEAVSDAHRSEAALLKRITAASTTNFSYRLFAYIREYLECVEYLGQLYETRGDFKLAERYYERGRLYAQSLDVVEPHVLFDYRIASLQSRKHLWDEADEGFSAISQILSDHYQWLSSPDDATSSVLIDEKQRLRLHFALMEVDHLMSKENTDINEVCGLLNNARDLAQSMLSSVPSMLRMVTATPRKPVKKRSPVNTTSKDHMMGLVLLSALIELKLTYVSFSAAELDLNHSLSLFSASLIRLAFGDEADEVESDGTWDLVLLSIAQISSTFSHTTMLGTLLFQCGQILYAFGMSLSHDEEALVYINDLIANEFEDDAESVSSESLFAGAIECAEKSFKILHVCGDTCVIADVCQLIVSCLVVTKDTHSALDQQTSWWTSFYVNFAMGLATRHRMLSIINKRRGSSTPSSTDVDSLSNRMSSLSLSSDGHSDSESEAYEEAALFSENENLPWSDAMQKVFDWKWSMNHFKKLVHAVDDDLPVCTISLTSGHSHLIVSRLERGVSTTISIPLSTQANSIDNVSNRFRQLIAGINDSKITKDRDTLNLKEKSNWWKKRDRSNKELQVIVEKVMEEEWLGVSRGIMMGSYQGMQQTFEEDVDSLAEGIQCLDYESRTKISVILRSWSASSNVQRQAMIRDFFATCPYKFKLTQRKQFNASMGAVAKKYRGSARSSVILLLSKEVQHLPWDAMKMYTSSVTGVYRNPSLEFVIARCSSFLSHCLADSRPPNHRVLTEGVDPVRAFAVVNPSGDLSKTQQRMEGLFSTMADWKSVIGTAPADEEMKEGIEQHDLYLYCGHGAGEDYLNRYKVQNVNSGGVALLMGCNSARLEPAGAFEPTGVVLYYLMSGCAAVVGNLWQVTDGDIDKYSLVLLQQWLHLQASDVSDNEMLEQEMLEKAQQVDTLGESVTAARAFCNHKYLNGAAPICYGVPVRVAATTELQETENVPAALLNNVTKSRTPSKVKPLVRKERVPVAMNSVKKERVIKARVAQERVIKENVTKEKEVKEEAVKKTPQTGLRRSSRRRM